MALEKFHYTHDDKEIIVPKFNQLPFGLIRKMRREAPDEQVFTMIEGACDKKALAVIDTLTSDEVAEFIEAWQEDAGITAGESAA